MHVRRATGPFFKLLAKSERLLWVGKEAGCSSKRCSRFRRLWGSSARHFSTPLPFRPILKRVPSSPREIRVLPLFSACPSLPLSRPISRTLMWISCLSRVLPFLILFRGKGVQVACIKFERCFVPEKRDTMQLRLNEGTMVNYFEEGLVSRVCLDREEFLTV